MDDKINLLVTLFQPHGLGNSLLRCALQCERWEGFDDYALRENDQQILDRLPEHVRSAGSICDVQKIFAVVAS